MVEEKRAEVVFDIKDERLRPLEVLVRDYFEKPGFEIKPGESE